MLLSKKKPFVTALALLITGTGFIIPTAAVADTYSDLGTSPKAAGCYWDTAYTYSSIKMYSKIGDHATGKNKSKLAKTIPSGASVYYEWCPKKGWVRASYQGVSGWIYNAQDSMSSSRSQTQHN